MTYPGSADNGATDLEYSPTPERIITSAADQVWATKQDVHAEFADVYGLLDELAAQIEVLAGGKPPRAILVDSIPCDAIRNVAFAALQGDIAGGPAVEVLGWLAEVAPTPKEIAE